MRNNQVRNINYLESSAHEAVENLVELIARLGAVLANETIFLRQMKISNIAPLQKEKEELTILLEKCKKQVEASRDPASGFSEQDKTELAAVGRIFSEIAMENYKELKKAREVNRRVIGCISAAATDYFTSQRSYDRMGGKGGRLKKHETLPPLTVNTNA